VLQSFSNLKSATLLANDGNIGTVKDLAFDDESWEVRYLVVDTGGWLPGRLVLISPVSLHMPDWEGTTIPVNLTKREIEESPAIEEDLPVSRQHEAELAKYYGWPAYWGERVLHGTTEALAKVASVEDATGNDPADRHLRSTVEVQGYRIHARDGEIGKVSDLLVKVDDWQVSSLIIEAGSWWSGHRVVMEPRHVRSIDWAHQEIRVAMVREAVRGLPPYDPAKSA
jgi:sporulation protein YlmC with PRC-barrel domain